VVIGARGSGLGRGWVGVGSGLGRSQRKSLLSDETGLVEAIVEPPLEARRHEGRGRLVFGVRRRVAEHRQHVLARGRVHRRVGGHGCDDLLVSGMLGRHVRGRLPVRRSWLRSVLAAVVAVRRERGWRLVRFLRVLLREHWDVGAVLRALVLGWRQRRLLLLQDYRRLVACNTSISALNRRRRRRRRRRCLSLSCSASRKDGRRRAVYERHCRRSSGF
jgi:hypothetical protein